MHRGHGMGMDRGSTYEVVQFVEPAPGSGAAALGPAETVLGRYPAEAEAIAAARAAWVSFRKERPRDVAWWLVRVPGEQLARWIADSHSDRERVVDLRTGRLVDIR